MGIFSKKPDHPLADLKSAQDLLGGLPKSDALAVLHEVTTWLESVREQNEFRLDHQFAVTRLLDEVARSSERKLARDLYAATPLSTFQENRVWMALDTFYAQLALADTHILERYRNGDKGAATIKPFLPLLGARGILAVACALKCKAARYALAGPELWRSLSAFYTHAEENNYLDDKAVLYAGQATQGSVRCGFAAVLAWHASSFGILARARVHLAERLSTHLCRYLSVTAQRADASLYCFDLQNPAPPQRASAEAAARQSMRYIGVQDVHSPLDLLLKTLHKNVVPEELNLGVACEAEAVQEVVRHLAASWATTPPVRRNARHSIKARLNVVSGFPGILEQSDIGLNFGDSASVMWEIADISSGSFRSVLPAAQVGGIKIGLLLGVKPEKMDGWGVGVVRRLSRDAHNNLQVGVQMLTNQMAGVALREQGVDGERPALWLDSSATETGEARLLIGPDAFSGSRNLHMHLGDKNYLLMPLKLEERGDDYELMRYRKMEEDSGTDESY